MNSSSISNVLKLFEPMELFASFRATCWGAAGTGEPCPPGVGWRRNPATGGGLSAVVQVQNPLRGKWKSYHMG